MSIHVRTIIFDALFSKKYIYIMFQNFTSDFSYSTLLSGFMLWVLFGIYGVPVSCDIRKFFKNNSIYTHALGVVLFFFLFTMSNDSDDDNKHIIDIWVSTIALYIFFVMWSKSKWYFSIPPLILLLIDQSIAMQYKYVQSTISDSTTNNNSDTDIIHKIRLIIKICVMCIITIGFIHYNIYQYNDKSSYSFYKLMTSYACDMSQISK
jgi:hypothetical protein